MCESRANILSAPLTSILKEEEVMKTTKGASLRDLFVETDYLQTVVIIVSSNQEKEFLHGYQLLAATAGTPALASGWWTRRATWFTQW